MKPTPELGNKIETQKGHAQQKAPWLLSLPQTCLAEGFDARSKQACLVWKWNGTTTKSKKFRWNPAPEARISNLPNWLKLPSTPPWDFSAKASLVLQLTAKPIKLVFADYALGALLVNLPKSSFESACRSVLSHKTIFWSLWFWCNVL